MLQKLYSSDMYTGSQRQQYNFPRCIDLSAENEDYRMSSMYGMVEENTVLSGARGVQRCSLASFLIFSIPADYDICEQIGALLCSKKYIF